MRVPLSWLKDFVNINIPVEELADKLCNAGVLVEKIDYPKEKISGVIIGEITAIEKHPDADKLRVAQVNTGGETLQIVTGASNVQAGDKIPVALAGAKLAGGLEIKKSALRGVDSYGMMCSAKELGIDLKNLDQAQAQGVMIFPADYKVGEDAVSFLNLDDPVLIFEPFANRPDCLSILGIAHEAANALGEKIKRKEFALNEVQQHASEFIKVKIEDYKDCPRYIARIIQDVKIIPSDLRVQLRLAAVGVRSVNNVVDITNCIMMELGQPLHAFDLDKVKGKEIIVRRAGNGEEIVTIDNQTLKLDENILVIASSSEPVAVAGIMGGAHSEISAATKNVLLESALFHPVLVRRGSFKLGLKSESSKRFEKGLDYYNLETASAKAASLIAGFGGRILRGSVEDADKAPAPARIKMRPERVNFVLGTDLSPDIMAAKLTGLGFIIERNKDIFTVEVPARRKDVKEEVDLVEEVARLTGYNNIAYTLPRGEQTCARFSDEAAFENNLRRCFEKSGLKEAYTYSLVHPDILAKFDINTEAAWKIINPLSIEQSYIRPQILPSLVGVIDYNLRNKNEDLFLFEVSNTYTPRGDGKYAAVAFCGNIAGKPVDFFAAKGVLDNVFADLNIQAEYAEAQSAPLMHPGISANVLCCGEQIGQFGKLHPRIQESLGIPTEVFVGEFDAALMMKFSKPREYKPFSVYPAVTRDVAVVVPKNLSGAQVRGVIEAFAGEYLIKCVCFDEYSGAQIQEGSKSLAFGLLFQAFDRTLKDEEINKAMEDIKTALKEKLNAGVRE